MATDSRSVPTNWLQSLAPKAEMRSLMCALFALLLAASAVAATRTWNGTTDPHWSVASNWAPAGAPQSGDELDFSGPNVSLIANMVNDLPSSVSLDSLYFNGGGWTVSGAVLRVRSITCFAAVTVNVPVQGLQYASGGTFTAGVDAGAPSLLVTGSGRTEIAQLSGSSRVDVGSTLALDGTSTFAGMLNVDVPGSYGQLILNGASAPNAPATSSGSISGSGKLAAVTIRGGALAPGAVTLNGEQTTLTPGRIDSGNLSFTAGNGLAGSYQVNVAGTEPGSGYSQVNVAGTVSLGSSPQLILNVANGFGAAPGQQFVIVANDGVDAVSGRFQCDGRIAAGYSCTSLAEGATFMAGGIPFRITYRGGDGNDVVLGVLGASATSLAASPMPSVAGQSVTFTATVSGSIAAPGGSVSFFDNGTLLGVAPVSGGQAVFAAPLRAGSHSIAATYAGDMAYASSTSAPIAMNVAKANSVAGVTASPSSSVAGQSVRLTATLVAAAPGSGVPTGSVAFYDNGAMLGSAGVAGGTAVLDTTMLAVGGGTIEAIYAGDTELNGSSASIARTIGKASTSVSATFAAPDPPSLQIGVVALPPGGCVPSGSVTVSEGSNQLATATLSAHGSAAVTLPSLAPGPHVFTVVYSGDARFTASSMTVARDDGMPLVVASYVSIAEGDAMHAIVIPIALSSPAAADVTVAWSTEDGTAMAGRDFMAASGTATFPAGSTSASIAVQILGNDVAEPDKVFDIVVVAATNAGVATPRVHVTLANDDTVPPRRRAARH